jgi:hypothetical protein
MTRSRHDPKRVGKFVKVAYAILAFFAVGYFPTYFLVRHSGPQVSMVALAVLIIPFAARASSVGKGLLLGLVLGFWGGLSTSYALIHKRALGPGSADRIIAIAILGTAFLCGAVSALFAHLATKRRKQIDAMWK